MHRLCTLQRIIISIRQVIIWEFVHMMVWQMNMLLEILNMQLFLRNVNFANNCSTFRLLIMLLMKTVEIMSSFKNFHAYGILSESHNLHHCNYLSTITSSHDLLYSSTGLVEVVSTLWQSYQAIQLPGVWNQHGYKGREGQVRAGLSNCLTPLDELRATRLFIVWAIKLKSTTLFHYLILLYCHQGNIPQS